MKTEKELLDDEIKAYTEAWYNSLRDELRNEDNKHRLETSYRMIAKRGEMLHWDYQKYDLAEKEPVVLICDCNSSEHQIIVTADKDKGLVFCHIHLASRGFFRRLINGTKYIFGYSCRFGHWEEFLFKKEHAVKLREISDLLMYK